MVGGRRGSREGRWIPGNKAAVGSTTHVFEAVALVVLQQPVPRAEVPLAEAAIADDALRRRAALLEIAPDLLLRHVG